MVYYATLKLMIVRGCDNSVTWGQFHQHLTSSFCERRSQEHKLTDGLTVYFCAFGIYAVKATLKHVGEINPRSQKRKMTDGLTVYFCAFGIYARESSA